ncbi:MAG: hypothetical protein AXW17_05155 [Colwellia sp. Phe_37]|nr:MAG: hypothetical protein AXW17_05155 [Colwellia sp. Phe_37]
MVKIFIFVALIVLSQVAIASKQATHPIQVNWINGSTVISEENVPTKITIDHTTLYLTITSVTESENKYFIAYHCQSEKSDSKGKVVSLSTGELNVVSISQTEPSKIDCGFNKVLELSLAISHSSRTKNSCFLLLRRLF